MKLLAVCPLKGVLERRSEVCQHRTLTWLCDLSFFLPQCLHLLNGYKNLSLLTQRLTGLLDSKITFKNRCLYFECFTIKFMSIQLYCILNPFSVLELIFTFLGDSSLSENALYNFVIFGLFSTLNYFLIGKIFVFVYNGPFR